MNYLTLENITKSYGDKLLFSGISLHINEGQKIGLIARNGTGKTTLLSVVSGQEGSEGERAKIIFKKDLKVGYLTQDPELHPDRTVLDELFEGDNPALAIVKQYEEALLLDKPELLKSSMQQMDDMNAWDIEAKAKEILSRLTINHLEQKVGTLSGGQKKRLALAKILIGDPEFLILDEPTNHLDVDMIDWLEEYLSAPGITLLLVTHDRYFLENVCNTIIELDEGKLLRYSGNYSEYLEKKANRQANDQINLEKDKKRFLKELEWARRMPQARGTKSKSRMDAFYQLKEDISNRRQELALQINNKANRLGSKILEAHNISKVFNDRTLFKNFSYKFKKFDRVGIVGPNGAGKSTLLQVLTEQMKPDTGKVIIGETVIFGYYTQTGMDMAADKRVIEVISEISDRIPAEKGHSLTAAQLLEKFMFPREQQQVFVSQLSGGEKRRLYLLTVLIANPNFLILDEPTNDLDIVTLSILEEYLETYQGCLLMVSHDRYFMDKLVDHVFAFAPDGTVSDFPGNYSQYRSHLLSEKNNASIPEVITKSTGKITYEEQKEIQKLEREIQKLNDRRHQINQLFLDPDMSLDQIQSLSQELEQITTKIQTAEDNWLELSEKWE